MNPFPVTLASDLGEGQAEPQWLIEGLWSNEAVGVLGGEPKCCKSYLALHAAVSVASGTPCLRSFAVHRTGPVLVFPAEDSHAIVRRRLDAIAAAAGISLEGLPVHVITQPTLMLDSPRDLRRLDDTVASVKPVLLVLDPFVRMHSSDENVAADVAPILGHLRELQRRHDVAVMLVHHARKDARRTRPGQALRGSSDFHGWGDSNLYLRQKAARLDLSIEHRAAPGRDGVPLALVGLATGHALQVLDDTTPHAAPPAKPDAPRRILDALAGAAAPLGADDLRGRCRMRAETFWRTLRRLVDEGRIVRTADDGYQIATTSTSAL